MASNSNKAKLAKASSVPKMSEIENMRASVVNATKNFDPPRTHSPNQPDDSIENNVKKIKDRGVDTMTPEILFSSEFIPIIKSSNEDPGLQIKNGSKTTSVNQVFKLIELHHSVQKSLNQLSIEFVEKQTELNLNEIYEEVSNEYDTDIIKSNFDKTLEAFIEKLESNLLKDKSRRSGQVSLGVAKNRAKDRTLKGKFIDKFDSKENKFNLSFKKKTRQTVRYVSFRNLLLEGTSVQKESIKRIIELVILEKLSSSIFKYFAKIIDLKEVQIPFYLDIQNLRETNARFGSPGSNQSVLNEMQPFTRQIIRFLRNSYQHVGNVSINTNFGGTAAVAAGGFDLESGAVSEFELVLPSGNAYNYVDFKSLGYKSVNNVNNYEMLYITFTNIIKALSFKTLGSIGSFSGYRAKLDSSGPLRLVDSSKNKNLKSAITEFVGQMCVSSFITGNTQNRYVYTNTKNGSSRKDVFTSHIINKNTIREDGKYTLQGETTTLSMDYNMESELRTMSKPTSPGVDSSMYMEVFPDSYADSKYGYTQFLSELLSLTLYDAVYALNRFSFNTTSFGRPFEGMEMYGRTLLGDHYSKTNASVPDNLTHNFNFSDCFQENDKKISHTLGLLGNVLFENAVGDAVSGYRVDANVSALPGDNEGFSSTPSFLSGKESIPYEAFYYNTAKSAKDYTYKLENFTNNVARDVIGLFGGDYFNKSLAEETLDNILGEFADNIETLINHIDDYNTDGTYTSERFRTAFSLFTMVCSGQHSSVLNGSFACTLLRSDTQNGCLPNNSLAWKTQFLYDSGNRVILHIFNSILGKTVQYYAGDDYEDGEQRREGQYTNYFETYDKDIGFTFLNKDQYNGSQHFVGRELEEDDYDDVDKIGFRSYNNNDFFGKRMKELFVEASGNIAVDPINAFYDLFKRKNMSFYKDFVSSESVDSNYVTSKSIEYNSTTEGEGHVSYDDMIFIKSSAERPGRLPEDFSMFRTNNVNREFAVYATLCNLVSQALSVKVTFKESNKKLYLTYSKTQLCALYDAIKSPNKQNLKYRSKFTDKDQSKNYKQNFNYITDILNEIKKPIIDRDNKVKRSFAILYSHINSFHSIGQHINKTVSKDNLSKSERLAIKYFGLTNEPQGSNNDESDAGEDVIIDKSDASMSLNSLYSINSNSYATMYKNFVDTVMPSKNNPIFAPKSSYTSRQIYQMQLAFNRDNYGHRSDDKLGKKTILSVGIPATQIQKLGKEANRKNSNTGYYNSPYVCVHIFKKNMLGENLLYYPKPFIFNTRLAAFENFRDINNITLPKQEVDFANIDHNSKLNTNFTLYTYDSENLDIKIIDSHTPTKLSNILQSSNDLKYINTLNHNGVSLSRYDVLKEMRNNHMTDYYLKMYMKLTTGIEISENVFPLYEHSKITNDVDSTQKRLYNMYSDQLFLNYPAINVDPILAREFLRLKKNISSSRFFSLNSKVKNVFGPKLFNNIYSLLINESDFVAYPYSEILTSGLNLNLTSMNQEFSAGGQAFINSLSDLYGKQSCPYFTLDGRQQIIGVSNEAMGSLVQHLGDVSNSQLSNFANENKQALFQGISGRQKSLIKHLNDVETENVADVYEFFAVITSIRRK